MACPRRSELLHLAIMDIVTHALAPVLIARLICRGDKRLGGRALIAIGVAGALPDLICPHLSLEARMSSWSHGLPCWGVFAVGCLVGNLANPRRVPLRLACLLAFAYLLHLVCDAVSGGVDWLYPVGHFVWGEYWVDPVWWIPLDVTFLLLAYFIFRLRPMFARSHLPPS